MASSVVSDSLVLDRIPTSVLDDAAQCCPTTYRMRLYINANLKLI